MQHRIRGLDALRFVCALWVVISHFGQPRSWEALLAGRTLGIVVIAVYHNLVSGPAAVIVFFVISGFCIHYPYRRRESIELVPFFARRHIRILTPMAVAIACAIPLGVELVAMDRTILWSLVCEEAYYTIYPLLLRLRSWLGWPTLLAVAFACSFFVILTNPTAGDYASYHWRLNWILGLPCWLLGCRLAEDTDSLLTSEAPISTSRVWKMRAIVWAASCLASVLRFHSPLGYPWTLNLFAILVAVWLKEEIVHAKSRSADTVLDRWGSFSYSMYLTHMNSLALWWLVPLPFLASDAAWPFRIGFAVVCAYAFYLVVERPSHQLARHVHAKVMARWEGRVARSATPA